MYLCFHFLLSRCGRFPPEIRTAIPVDGRFEHIVLSCHATSDHGIIWIEKEARKALEVSIISIIIQCTSFICSNISKCYPPCDGIRRRMFFYYKNSLVLSYLCKNLLGVLHEKSLLKKYLSNEYHSRSFNSPCAVAISTSYPKITKRSLILVLAQKG